MRIVILYGTETGNAEMLSEDLAASLSPTHDVSVHNMQDVTPAIFKEDALFLIVSSTYGEGELPASAKAFMASLESSRPSLADVRFAIFGLGDKQYFETFGFGSKAIAERLISLGARQISEREVHDASGPDLPEDHAARWLEGVFAAYEAV